MHKTTLRKVGGSVMLSVPPALLAEIGLAAGATVGLRVSGGKLVVEKRRPRYTLEALVREHEAMLADRAARRAQGGEAAAAAAREEEDERVWLDEPPVGREEI